MKARRAVTGLVDLGTAFFFLVALAFVLPRDEREPFADACKAPRQGRGR